MRAILFLMAACISVGSRAQESSESKFTVGIEQDILPYLTGGYFANVWAGKNHVRVRLLTAYVHKPEILVEDPFENNRITAYAALVDYFLKSDWSGWWAGTGLVLWKNSLQTEAQTSTAHFDTWLINGSLGYSWKFYKNFYVSPWAGLHLRVGGTDTVQVDGETYTPPLLNPEASIKVGWHF